MVYKQLTYIKRCEIAAFYKAGYSQKEIAIKVGVHPSTISREIRRNRRWNGVYCPKQAEGVYQNRRLFLTKPAKELWP